MVFPLDIQIPEKLIAQYPLKDRSSCRLLCLDKKNGAIEHKNFSNIIDYINKGDLLVLNDTKVINARLFCRKQTGGKAELLLLRELNQNGIWHSLIGGKNIGPGTRLFIEGTEYSVLVTGNDADNAVFTVDFGSAASAYKAIKEAGVVPLPPYIKRKSNGDDSNDYQTVFATEEGSVAAPTASLHFTDELLLKLQDKGVVVKFITLHVGYGTFAVIKDIANHRIHSEFFSIPQDTAGSIKSCRLKGGRIWASGTTVVRALESAFDTEARLIKSTGETSLFIKPFYKFNIVDSMITNFHHPQTTLILLVSAFAGEEFIKKAYEEAIFRQYRFLSYGDSMLIT